MRRKFDNVVRVFVRMIEWANLYWMNYFDLNY